MKRIHVLVALTGLVAMLGQARADDLFAVLQTGDNETIVDTVIMQSPAGTDTVPTPGFGGAAGIEDTFDFSPRELPRMVHLSWLYKGNRQQAFSIPEIIGDQWYDFPVGDPALQQTRIKFVGVAAITEKPRVSPQARLSAYPNPFAHQTRLSARLTRTARVFIDLFDESGIKVRSLAAGEFAAGDHHWSWDGRNAHGRRLASGVYLARLAAGDERSLVKLVLTD